ncbi:UTP--GlnB (protein PII) uridylyltransferase, GlnD [Rhizobiales bacterium GAS191]|nr:UTP--GlnB (protein PII) uridylyltransferase, GlnD [Rhizobiales bacterium GAS113]SEB99123.1 UTP--GlnB (protein PII) uridylyltransferase, GlnD [Rhizobiales bacterium GAS188]SED23910.1 UTP--GlnB (protein PII) uridylyltransferase, GlnD [Rhizobiales bacterium GAS191]
MAIEGVWRVTKSRQADGSVGREALIAHLRDKLAEGRAEAERILIDRIDGRGCAAHLCAVMDRLIATAYDFVTGELYPADNPSTAERMAVVATGGYGRGLLAPGSDIDLLFILPYKASPWCESVIEAVLYLLWDLKLKVGHATRTVEECLRSAKADMTIRTALLEARFLLGERDLFDSFARRFEAEIVAGSAPAFVAAKLAERDARLKRSGNASRYLVEPNVKEGKGGLRDLNTLFWIGKYVYRVKAAKDLVEAGLFSPEEFSLFQRCEEFLWRVRCHMHFVAGRAEERLSFDMQRLVAERLKVVGREGLSGIERFMKRYFLIAKDVGDLTAIVCAAMEAREAMPRPLLDRFLGRFRRKRTRFLDTPGFAVWNGRLTLAADDVFETDPVNLIRLFWLADKRDLAIHPEAKHLVTRSLKLITRTLREDPEANRLFVEMLTSRNAPETVLRHMNEAGVLGRFIPEFGRVVAMMQFNMYHHYTVDEHLIRAIGGLSEIDAGRAQAEHPLSNTIFHTIQNRRALYVALFLHDIAKGRAEDHSLLGARIARKLCPRFGMNEAETETAAWLVEHHLLMSTTAQSRDLSDPSTIESFGAVVQSLERLKLLMVLTIADIKAVGPGVWTGWKGELLRTLYYETEVLLAGGHSAVERGERVRLAQNALRARLADWSAAEFDAYARRHYPAYWLRVPLNSQVQHAHLIANAERDKRLPATAIETDSFRGVTTLTLFAPDHPHLLSLVFGACAMAGANIVDAQIFTTSDGRAIDTIAVSRAFDQDADELRRAERVAETIEQLLEGRRRIADIERRDPKRARAKTFDVASEVVIDNTLSSRHTVVEVSGLDRQGLLFDLTSQLSALNLNIVSAHIATFGERAVDVFYVTDLTGAQITAATRQNTIRRRLLGVFKTE